AAHGVLTGDAHHEVGVGPHPDGVVVAPPHGTGTGIDGVVPVLLPPDHDDGGGPVPGDTGPRGALGPQLLPGTGAVPADVAAGRAHDAGPGGEGTVGLV